MNDLLFQRVVREASRFDALDLLTSVAALQVMPTNISRTVRLEVLAHAIATHAVDTSRAKASLDDLRQLCNDEPLACDDSRSTFVAIGDQIKEQLAADPFERHESDLVHDEHVDAQQALLQSDELARIPCFEELPHQIGGARKEHAAFLFRGFDTQCDRQVGLSGADRAGHDEIFGRGDPLAAREGVDVRKCRLRPEDPCAFNL